MIVLFGQGNAAFTNIAMKSLLFTTDSTNSTFVTVEYFLSLKVVVIKRANFAVIARKVDLTLSACFRLWLFFIAAQTLNSSYLVSIKLVFYLSVLFIFIHHFVVTESTTPKLSFANLVWTLFLAASTVVFTAKLFHWLRFFLLALSIIEIFAPKSVLLWDDVSNYKRLALTLAMNFAASETILLSLWLRYDILSIIKGRAETLAINLLTMRHNLTTSWLFLLFFWFLVDV